MSIVNLRLYEPDSRRDVIDGHTVGVRRLKGTLAFGRLHERALFDCVIDTGAYLMVVPQVLWYPLFQNDIHWLTKEADPLLPAWLHGITGIDGQTCRTRLGILPMRLIGGLGQTLRWIDVTGISSASQPASVMCCSVFPCLPALSADD